MDIWATIFYLELHVCFISVSYSSHLSVLKSNWVELYLHKFMIFCKMLFIDDFLKKSWWKSLFEVNGIILQFTLCICRFLHLGSKGSWVFVQISTTLINPSHFLYMQEEYFSMAFTAGVSPGVELDMHHKVIPTNTTSLAKFYNFLSILGDFIACFSWLTSVSHIVSNCVNYWSQWD